MSDPINVQDAAQAAGSLGAVLFWAHHFMLPELKKMREAVEANTLADVTLHKTTHDALRAIGAKLGATIAVLALVLGLNACSLSPAVREQVGAWREAWHAYDAAPVTSENAAERAELRVELEGALRDVERAAQ